MKNKNQQFTITGRVLSGQNLGGKIGAHTANLDISFAKNLTKGLYACNVSWNNSQNPGLLYYGYNSISQKDCLEVHILNFSHDIYGQEITVETTNFLRPEIKFNNLEELKIQIKKDLAAAAKLIQ